MISLYYKKNHPGFWNFLKWLMSSVFWTTKCRCQYQIGMHVLYGILSEIRRTAQKLFQFSGSKIHFLWKANYRFARLTLMAPILKDRDKRALPVGGIIQEYHMLRWLKYCAFCCYFMLLKKKKIDVEKVGKSQFESKFQLYEVTLWLTVSWGLAIFHTAVYPVGIKKAQHDY